MNIQAEKILVTAGNFETCINERLGIILIELNIEDQWKRYVVVITYKSIKIPETRLRKHPKQRNAREEASNL